MKNKSIVIFVLFPNLLIASQNPEQLGTELTSVIQSNAIEDLASQAPFHRLEENSGQISTQKRCKDRLCKEEVCKPVAITALVLTVVTGISLGIAWAPKDRPPVTYPCIYPKRNPNDTHFTPDEQLPEHYSWQIIGKCKNSHNELSSYRFRSIDNSNPPKTSWELYKYGQKSFPELKERPCVKRVGGEMIHSTVKNEQWRSYLTCNPCRYQNQPNSKYGKPFRKLFNQTHNIQRGRRGNKNIC